MIDPSMFSLERLVAELLYDAAGNVDAWRKYAEVIPAYVPPHVEDDVPPRCVVRCAGAFLCYSQGPAQGYYWDVGGDDMGTPERALLALCAAPPPPQLIRRPAE